METTKITYHVFTLPSHVSIGDYEASSKEEAVSLAREDLGADLETDGERFTAIASCPVAE